MRASWGVVVDAAIGIIVGAVLLIPQPLHAKPRQAEPCGIVGDQIAAAEGPTELVRRMNKFVRLLEQSLPQPDASWDGVKRFCGTPALRKKETSLLAPVRNTLKEIPTDFR